ncbi:MAG: DUF72 domain-containing protein, partial [Candidatus Aminicenantes bacterium]
MAYYLGTSGWSYSSWKERFYPSGIPQRDWLRFYAEHFNSVEINMTFYRFPKAEVLQDWAEKTPHEFKFTLKANRQITHRKKLFDVEHDVRYFNLLVGNLGDKLGCLLFQLPPSLHLDLKLLRSFLSTLSTEYNNVIEFRHESWYTESVYDLLRSKNVTFCTVSSERVPDQPVNTAETAYFRFHGLTGGFRYNYSDRELQTWADLIQKTAAKELYVYFNNDYQAQAV